MGLEPQFSSFQVLDQHHRGDLPGPCDWFFRLREYLEGDEPSSLEDLTLRNWELELLDLPQERSLQSLSYSPH
jgi:hypothetical protein